MSEKLCRVTITDIKAGGYVVEVKPRRFLKRSRRQSNGKAVTSPRIGFRPIKVMVYEPKAEYEVKLKDVHGVA